MCGFVVVWWWRARLVDLLLLPHHFCPIPLCIFLCAPFIPPQPHQTHLLPFLHTHRMKLVLVLSLALSAATATLGFVRPALPLGRNPRYVFCSRLVAASTPLR